MNFFSRCVWAYRFAKEVPIFRKFEWTGEDRDQTSAWLRSPTGRKMLQELQNRVTYRFYDGAALNQPELSQRGMGIWQAVCAIKLLSEDEPNLAQLSGIPAPVPKQDTTTAPTEDANRDHLFP